MRFSSANNSVSEVSTDLLVLVSTKREILPAKAGKKAPKEGWTLSYLDYKSDGSLFRSLLRANFKYIPGSSFLFTLQNRQIGSLLLIVAPEKASNGFDTYSSARKIGSTIYQHAKKVGAKNAVIHLGPIKLDNEPLATAFLEGLDLSAYSYTAYKTEPQDEYTLPDITFISNKKLNEKVIENARSLCEATKLARDLVNMPPNDCTPPFLVKTATKIAKAGGLALKIFDKKDLAKLGAHSLLSVAKGTAHPPYLIKLTYAPKKKNSRTKVISIVGKGITFDTGGYSLKPGDSMIGMGGDMAGAAAVLGAMQYVAALKPSCEVRGYIPTTENMISGEATRVGDIVKAMNGKTIEILNTDAEGRLILADALTMASKDKAHIIIDLATLTGACLVALGLEYAGLFTDDEKLAADITSCGAIEGERYWRLPLAPEYKESLKSRIADLKNVASGRWGGAIIGGLFLQHFVSDCRWAHIDIAGPADAPAGKDHITSGGVGFGVRTLGRFISKQ